MPCLGGFAGVLPLRLGGAAETSITAQQHARLAADLVAAKRTAPLCVFAWSTVGSTSTPAIITYYFGQNGEGLAFAPASSVTGDSALYFRFATPAFTDPYQITEPIRPRMAAVTMSGSTYRRGTATLLTDGVSIYVRNANGQTVNPQPAGFCVLW